jgi:flavin-dependent dehydrogenase
MVWFEADLLPGYAWSFPLPDGRANVGFGIRRGRGITTRDMKQLWPELLARPHVRDFLGAGATPEAPHKAWPIPARLGRLPMTAANGRALFVGDAAAATDLLTGEGIAQALVTGRLASAAIVAAGADGPARAATIYEREVRRELGPDDRMSSALSSLLGSSVLARAALRAAGMNEWSRTRFVQWMFEAVPRAGLFTPSRWASVSFRRAGAFAGPR